MRNYPDLGIQVADMLLPRPDIDRKKWAVIAVDQFTSQPEYWERVAQLIGSEPSAFHLILPEAMLGKEGEAERIISTQKKMSEYIDSGLLVPVEGLIYVERTIGDRTRRGLMLALDLEKYDYQKGSKTLIRATEGTIIDRLPPRMKIRRGAVLELPHILVLIDDPEGAVIGVAQRNVGRMQTLYDFELMEDSGSLRGYLIDDPALEEQIVLGFEKLADRKTYFEKYGVDPDKEGLMLFAMGDGNHSLATAKAIWEELKPQVGMDHPARYALVEIENLHDEGLDFEPIHRVLFGVHSDPIAFLTRKFGRHIQVSMDLGCEEMQERVRLQLTDKQVIGLVTPTGYGVIEFDQPTHHLPVGTLQAFLDDYLKDGGAESIDYVHGADTVCELGSQPGNVGFFLPAMAKKELFKTVLLEGALPRKTFSMGEAKEKRFYMEARRIA